jgi:type IV pilus assembly protein PilW
MPRKSAAGFSLIEILISMLIALVTFLIMFQMFDRWDQNKRSTASGGGAMVSGSLAMFRLERDLRLAGFGFGNAVELGCAVNFYDQGPPVRTGTTFPMEALRIVDGAAGAPDQIIALYGSSEGAWPSRFFGTSSSGAQPYTAASSTNATMEIGALGGMNQGDLVILGQGPIEGPYNCDLVEITNTLVGDRRTFQFVQGTNYTHFYTGGSVAPRYNNPVGVPAASGTTGRVYVLGPRPQRHIWQIINGRTLAFSNDLPTYSVSGATGAEVVAADVVGVNTEIADNIVNLQAQYGVATPPGSAAAAACTPVANPTWTAVPPAAACQAFVWAVRVALLARSDQAEKTAVTTTPPTWAGGTFGMLNLDGTAQGTNPANPNLNWRNYRYKVFESMIPLKNVMWGSR